MFSVNRVITAALCVALTIFLSNYPTYQYNVLGGVAPLFFYFFVFALGVLAFLLRPSSISGVLREPLFVWFVVYAFSGAVWVLFVHNDLEVSASTWRLRFLVLMLFFSTYLIAINSDITKVSPLIAGLGVVAALTFWHDFANPFLYVPHDVPGANPGRGAGFFINANQAANALIAMCICILPFVARGWRFAIVIVMFAGVFPTFSRSSILFAAIVALLWFSTKQIDRRGVVALAGVSPFLIIGAFLVFQFGLTSDETNVDNILSRIDFFTSGGEATDHSATERQFLLGHGLQKFQEYGVLGIGIGETRVEVGGRWDFSTSTHNMFLVLGVEQGLLGLVLYLLFILILFFRGFALYLQAADDFGRSVGFAIVLFALYFVFIGFFSHTMLEEPYTVMLLAILLAQRARLADLSLSTGRF